MSASFPEIILASGSPRRSDLLRDLGVRFAVITSQVRELDAESAPHLSTVELACENARVKAQAVASLHPGRWILGADTVVALDGRVFGKPTSLAEARAFLRILSGKAHEVTTGCTLVDPQAGVEIFHATTRVTFRILTKEAIDRYLDTVHVLDKAGGYALQERGEWIIENVDGSPANVIGLPVEQVETVFKRRGLL